MKLWARQKGFTIVELIIVIVVIAILASISVVAYSGVTARAENIKTLDAVSKYVDALTIYASQHGGYPLTLSGALCLGAPSGGTCGHVTAGPEGCGNYSVKANVNTVFDGQIKESLGNTLPQPSMQIINCEGKQHKGALYYAWSGNDALITYFLKGNEQCGIKSFKTVERYQSGELTACTGFLDS